MEAAYRWNGRQKKVALFSDLSGFGRCAITVALPVISKLKVQCCPVPTAIFSNHSAFPTYYRDDYTERMEPYVEQWKKLGLSFDGIETGFLGSFKQFRIVSQFIDEFRNENTLVVVDPVMGDHGKLYSSYGPELCGKMGELAAKADIITPNLTEACILTDTSYHEGKWKRAEMQALAEKLSAMGPEKVVITGIPQGEYIANYCYEQGRETLLRTRRVGNGRCGTGDIFAAVITADAVNGIPFAASVKKASSFIRDCILRSDEMDIPMAEGVCFEELLDRLKP